MAGPEVMIRRPAEQEADQLAFFDCLADGFCRAESRTGVVERDFSIGGFVVRLRFAGPSLIPKIVPAIEHLASDSPGDPDFTIELFDAQSSGAPLPYLADRLVELLRMRWWEHLENRRELAGMNGPRIRSVFHLGPDILSVMDSERNRAVYWVEEADSIPYYEVGYPLTVLLNWWLASQGRYFVHAASIGDEHGGLLLTGKGGSGKSTTTLACVTAGQSIGGDDYAAVDPRNSRAYSLYNTIKLKGRRDVDRFPGLARQIDNLDRIEEAGGGEKAMLFLHQHYPQTLVGSMPLRAILVPRIVDQPTTEIIPASRALAFKALAPSTLFQLPGNAGEAFRSLVQMVQRIPCHEILLGSDLSGVPRAISNFLHTSP